MKAFNADPDLKETLVEKAKQHRLADEYIKGDYGKEQNGAFKGCSLGCTVFDINTVKDLSGSVDDYAFLAKQLDIPEFITHLQDCIFEGLEADLRTHWTERLLTAIPVGADLTPVLPVVLLSLLDGLPPQEDEVKAAIERVKKVLVKWIETGQVDEEEAKGAADKARTTGAIIRTAAWAAARVAEAAAHAAARVETWVATWTALAAERAARVAEATAWTATSVTGATIGAAKEAAWADTADKLILSIQTTTKGVRQ